MWRTFPALVLIVSAGRVETAQALDSPPKIVTTTGGVARALREAGIA